MTGSSFDAWVSAIFEHQAVGNAPYWDDEQTARVEEIEAQLQAPVKFEYVARLFENAGTLLGRFSDAQAAEGLSYISGTASGYLFLWDTPWKKISVEWPEKERLILSMVPLFEHCFAKRCAEYRSAATKDAHENPLNGVCYMWWDAAPLGGVSGMPDNAKADALCLDVMDKTLQLDSLACRESALHGLGHWHAYHPERVCSIIDVFLRRNPSIPVELKSYALSAREGLVQ